MFLIYSVNTIDENIAKYLLLINLERNYKNVQNES